MPSSKEVKLSGSVIPPDVSLCDECLRELRNPKNERYEYFFITCTNRGPRYTIIEGLPYDRPNTTSCGRVPDAVSAILDVCYERTYEGEPAMKLESAATKGRDVLNLTPELKGNTINTTSLVHEILSKRGNHSVADLACSAQSYLAKALAQLAVEEAERLGVGAVGFSGALRTTNT